MPGFPGHSLEEWLLIAKKANDDSLGFTGLPAAAQNYIKKVEAIVGVPCTSVGVGPDRDATIDAV
jgi:adenylosuccinate synthase